MGKTRTSSDLVGAALAIATLTCGCAQAGTSQPDGLDANEQTPGLRTTWFSNECLGVVTPERMDPKVERFLQRAQGAQAADIMKENGYAPAQR